MARRPSPRRVERVRKALDREFTALLQEMGDVPGGERWCKRVRALVEQGAYCEAMHQLLHPPFWWGPDRWGREMPDPRYHVAAEYTLVPAIIEYGRLYERGPWES